MTAQGFVALATVVVLAACTGTSGHRVAPSPSGPAVATVQGYRWSLRLVTDSSGSLTLPPNNRATLGFTRNGWLILGRNAVRVRYRLVRGGYVTRATRIAVPAGDVDVDISPTLLRLWAAENAMIYDPGPGTVVHTSLSAHGSRLRLRNPTGSITLALHRSGREPNFHR